MGEVILNSPRQGPTLNLCLTGGTLLKHFYCSLWGNPYLSLSNFSVSWRSENPEANFAWIFFTDLLNFYRSFLYRSSDLPSHSHAFSKCGHKNRAEYFNCCLTKAVYTIKGLFEHHHYSTGIKTLKKEGQIATRYTVTWLLMHMGNNRKTQKITFEV